ncbi:hypothetical protein LCGC14_0728100 [marine sediment metagenome]|uniref:Uncharacterized protein n=1 Tax=marine sediment metagenome TaxID=412755 RepID=A0A0F9THN3_9ZZZZ
MNDKDVGIVVDRTLVARIAELERELSGEQRRHENTEQRAVNAEERELIQLEENRQLRQEACPACVGLWANLPPSAASGSTPG